MCETPGYAEAVLQACPSLEILDSKFTTRYGPWAVAYATRGAEIDLTDRGISHLKAELFVPAAAKALRTLDIRRNAFGNLLSDVLNPLKGATQLRSLWLDRGATSRADIFAALPHLEEVNGAAMDESDDLNREVESRVQAVLDAMWRNNQCYKIGSADGAEKAEVWCMGGSSSSYSYSYSYYYYSSSSSSSSPHSLF